MIVPSQSSLSSLPNKKKWETHRGQTHSFQLTGGRIVCELFAYWLNRLRAKRGPGKKHQIEAMQHVSFFPCQMSAWEKNTARHKKPLTRLKLISRRLNDLAVTGFHTYSTHTQHHWDDCFSLGFGCRRWIAVRSRSRFEKKNTQKNKQTQRLDVTSALNETRRARQLLRIVCGWNETHTQTVRSASRRKCWRLIASPLCMCTSKKNKKNTHMKWRELDAHANELLIIWFFLFLWFE